jgi:hypothetical protein
VPQTAAWRSQTKSPLTLINTPIYLFGNSPDVVYSTYVFVTVDPPFPPCTIPHPPDCKNCVTNAVARVSPEKVVDGGTGIARR